MERYGDKARNAEGQMVVDFATRMEMAVVNTYFKKREEHRVTYKSGGRSMQVDYIMCRRAYMKEIGDCKVIAGDNVAKQQPTVWFHAREKHYRCIVCFESVDGEVQKRSEGATLCVCGPGESLRQGAKRRGVVLHEKVWIGREVRENSTRYV